MTMVGNTIQTLKCNKKKHQNYGRTVIKRHILIGPKREDQRKTMKKNKGFFRQIVEDIQESYIYKILWELKCNDDD